MRGILPGSHLRAAAAVVGLTLLLGACGTAGGAEAGSDSGQAEKKATAVRLGYFPNLTHAPALVGVQQGLFADALGDDIQLSTTTFNAGPAAVEALFSEAIDATYIGPNPAINAYAQSKGEAVRIISGATSGGAFLIVNDDIKSAEDLKGKTLSSPQLGNTQDVALRAWLAEQGYKTDQQGGGDVKVQPQENSQILETFIAGEIDGAWVPEPYATRLIKEGKGHVLVDERDLWEGGRYVTTHLLVRTAFLDANPELVKKLLEAHVQAVAFVNDEPEKAKTAVNAALQGLTGKAIDEEVLDAAWKNLTFTTDPVAASLKKSAESAEAVGLLEPVDLEGIYSLDLLNEVLDAAGAEPVSAS